MVSLKVRQETVFGNFSYTCSRITKFLWICTRTHVYSEIYLTVFNGPYSWEREDRIAANSYSVLFFLNPEIPSNQIWFLKVNKCMFKTHFICILSPTESGKLYIIDYCKRAKHALFFIQFSECPLKICVQQQGLQIWYPVEAWRCTEIQHYRKLITP